MNIHEYQGKEIFRRFGVSVADGGVASTPEEAESIARSLKTDVIAVKSDHDFWYQDVPPAAIDAIVEVVQDYQRGYKSIATYGSSMGGNWFTSAEIR